jgi:hypothetical protein
MEITLPTDCGNAPRIGIVGDFAVNWAQANEEAIADWLSDDLNWTLAGADTPKNSTTAGDMNPPFKPERVEVLSIITHGRLASCDGYLEAGEKRLLFSHVFRFATTAKTAKIVELRSYCVSTSDNHHR